MRVRLGAYLATILCCVAPLAASGQAYPSRQITMIVPFPAGSGPDVYARLSAQSLRRVWASRL